MIHGGKRNRLCRGDRVLLKKSVPEWTRDGEIRMNNVIHKFFSNGGYSVDNCNG